MMNIAIYRRFARSLRLVALALFTSCADYQDDGVQIDSSIHHLQQAVAEKSCSSFFQPTLPIISTLLGGYSDLYHRPEDAAKLHALHNELIAEFWQFRHSQAQKNQKDIIKLTDDLENMKQNLSSEMELLSELFQDPMPARERTLLYILGDTLISLSDRLAANVVFYDFSCKLIDCHLNRETSEFKDLVHLIAALPDQERLNNLLSETNGPLMLRPEWRDIFVSIADPSKHGVLQEAVLIATRQTVYTPDLMRSATNVPDSMKMFSSVLLRCQRWVFNMEHFGYFENESRPHLSADLNHERIAEWGQGIRRQLDDLNAAYSQLTTDRNAVLEALHQGMNQKRDRLATETKFKQIRLNIEKTVSELRILQADIARTEMGQTFAQDLGALRDEGQLDEGAEIQVGSTVRVNISPGYAQKGIPSNISTWALPEQVLKPMYVERGHVISLMVQGTWSPTCALRIIKPDAARALVGSEGFSEQLIDGQVQAVSVVSGLEQSFSRSSSYTHSLSGEAFAQVGAEFMGSKAGVRLSIQSTETQGTGFHQSQREVRDDINLTERRIATSFSAGMRLPNTPFPDFPAGSLLMVIQSTVQEQDITIEVVRPQINFVAPYSGHVWFVVNDLVDSDCKGTNTGNHLDLHIRVTKPISTAATQLGEAMATVISELNERLSATIELQPTLLITSSVRSDIIAKLHRRGIRLEELPLALSNLFQAFLDKALASWERKLMVIDRERDLQALRLEEAAVEQDLAMNESQRRLNDIDLTWSVDGVDIYDLHWRTIRLLRLASETLIPTMRLLYPEHIAAMSDKTQPMAYHLAKLRDFPFKHDFASLVLSAKSIISYLEENFYTIRSHASTPGRTGIALTFVRPGRSTLLKFSQVDSARAQSLWHALELGGEVTIALQPEDIYRPEFIHSESLNCNQCTPILRFMGGYFVVPAGTADSRNVNSLHFSVSTTIYSDLLFVTPDAPSLYSFRRKEFRIPLKMGEDGQVRSTSVWGDKSGYALNEASGFSPFTSFTFNFNRTTSDTSDLTYVLDEATAFVLLMDVETKACEKSSLKWLEVCR